MSLVVINDDVAKDIVVDVLEILLKRLNEALAEGNPKTVGNLCHEIENVNRQRHQEPKVNF